MQAAVDVWRAKAVSRGSIAEHVSASGVSAPSIKLSLPTGRVLRFSTPVEVVADGDEVLVDVIDDVGHVTHVAVLAVATAPPGPATEKPPAAVAAVPDTSKVVAGAGAGTAHLCSQLCAQGAATARKGAWAAGNQQWTYALQLDPGCKEALWNQAMYQLSLERPDSAVPLLRTLQDKTKKCVPISLALCTALLRSGDVAGAVAEANALNDRVLSKPQTFDLRKVLDTSAVWSGVDPETGFPFPTKTTSTDVVASLGRCLLTAGDKKAAVGVINALIQSPEAEAHPATLRAYADVAADIGDEATALQVYLKLVVLDKENKVVRKGLARLLGAPEGIARLMVQVPPSDEAAAAAYGFLAVVVKDHGYLPTSIALYEAALKAAPSSHTIALNLIHAYECIADWDSAFRAAVNHLVVNSTTRVGPVRTADILRELAHLKGINVSTFYSTAMGKSAEPLSAPSIPSLNVEWRAVDPSYAAVWADGQSPEEPSASSLITSADELDLLATWFTIVKILHAVGALPFIPPLLRLIERVRRGAKLHLTTIRNEHAYYCCIAQLMQFLQRGVPGPDGGVGCPPLAGLLPKLTSAPPIFVCGDSHSLSPSWHTVTVADQPRLLVPALVTGLKAWHLRPESTFYPKVNYQRVLQGIPDGSDVLMIFCEIDCREGLLVATAKGRYDTLEDAIRHVAAIYMDALKELVVKRKMRVFVHPVVPVLKETLSIVKMFNVELQRATTTLGRELGKVSWLQFFPRLLSDDGSQFNTAFELDGTHVSPAYLPLLASSLEAAVVEMGSS